MSAPAAQASGDLFYVVLRDDDRRLFRHEYVAGNQPADAEAGRLAAMYPGHKFYVLKVVRYAHKAAPPKPAPQSLPEGVELHQVNLPPPSAYQKKATIW